MENKDVKDLRREYDHSVLLEQEAGNDPFTLFSKWFDDALQTELEATAVTLATANPNPSARTVLLKEVKDKNFVFYTNYNSSKGRAIDSNPNVCLLFFWQNLQRQVRIEGMASKVSEKESIEYFTSRPFESRVGAWASRQSTVLESREDLDNRYAHLLEHYADGDVPKPENWGGYAVKPAKFEFWQGRPSRLHDRLEYILENNLWVRRRLSP